MGSKEKVIKFDIKLTDEQKKTKNTILSTPVNFIIGSEGTGKTMLGVNIALDLFFKREYSQIIITRPTVASEDFGYLPGDVKEKIAPFLVPIYENIRSVYGSTDIKRAKIEKHFNREDIRILPIAFTRGVTYDNAIVIVDEFQNCTLSQLEMIIGRLGRNSKLIFTGSKNQIDLKKYSESSISILDKIKDNPFVSINILTKNHRHEAVESILNQIRNEKS